MAFKKMEKSQFPSRLWSLVGYAGAGKSTFATRMKGSKLVIDADHRFSEVLDLSKDEVFQLSDNASDNVDPDAITKHLLENMPDSGVKTVIVDSLTAIIMPIIVQALIDRDKGREKNLMSGFKNKAMAMRQIQDAVTRWGTDVLWIYHLQDARDAKAKEITRATISQTELARLTRSINMQLEIVQEGDKRGIKVVWARRGRSGLVLWDESGSWESMPEKIEEAVYGGLSKEEQDRIEEELPKVFPNAENAIAWGVEQGVFPTVEASKRAYDALKAEALPTTAKEMANLWVAEVRSRKAAQLGEQAVLNESVEHRTKNGQAASPK